MAKPGINGFKYFYFRMKFRLLYLLTGIFILTLFIQCTDSITGESESDDLAAPSQIAPDEGAGSIPLKPTFEWGFIKGADAYILHASSGNQMIIEEQVGDTSYVPSDR